MVVLHGAHDLIVADRGLLRGSSDPYVLLTIEGHEPRRSRTIKSTCNPRWEEAVEFEGVLGELIATPLAIELWDEDSSWKDRSDDPLGSLMLTAVELGGLAHKPLLSFSRSRLEGVPKGSLTFTVRWVPLGALDA